MLSGSSIFLTVAVLLCYKECFIIHVTGTSCSYLLSILIPNLTCLLVISIRVLNIFILSPHLFVLKESINPNIRISHHRHVDNL
jgi:hypothetical protein